MTSRHRAGYRLITTVAVAAIVAVTGSVAPAAAAPAPEPDRAATLAEFSKYWTAVPYDTTSEETRDATAWRGNVTDAGATVLAENDHTLLDINYSGTTDEEQVHRALIDADYDWKQTYADAFGPVISKYFVEGLKDGSLPLTTAAIDEIGKAPTTGNTKTIFNYPRPFLADRSFGGKNDLKGLEPTLSVMRIPDWTDPQTGLTHSADYQGLYSGRSQSFPSGHTTYAYQTGLELAMLAPELAPQILARASEAGNNRLVLGVHYPLDVIGGRVLSHQNVSSTYSDPEYVEKTLKPAREELKKFLGLKCAQNGYGRTLEACIENVGANDRGGYVNTHLDVVGSTPVMDRASALIVYQQRMTYGFSPVGDTQQTPVVPEGAENLLLTTFPQLNNEQRREVLAATEIDSGHVLDSSAGGWSRLDLPSAMSSLVTLDRNGKVVGVEPGQMKPSVMVVDAEEPTDPEPSEPSEPTEPGNPVDPVDPGQPGEPGDPGDGQVPDPSVGGQIPDPSLGQMPDPSLGQVPDPSLGQVIDPSLGGGQVPEPSWGTSVYGRENSVNRSLITAGV